MRHLLISFVSLVLLSSCGPELHAPHGVKLCRQAPPPDMGPPLGPGCVPCTNTKCAGPELSLCSSCREGRVCITSPVNQLGGGCCDTRPLWDPDGDLPLCHPSLSGAPKGGL